MSRVLGLQHAQRAAVACSGCWSAAYRCWGVQHKEAPLRVCTNAHGVVNNVEFKALDATANPYIALAALISAGLLVLPCPCLLHVCYCWAAAAHG
jgi:glutamine synthetase